MDSLIHDFKEIIVKTEHPIAEDSPDHLHPHGTAKNNSINLLFNKKLFQLFDSLKAQIKVLDLGCSGGGFVRSCLNEGCLAIGLEGSDYSRKFCRAEWPLLANKFLFTADISKPFSVKMMNREGEKTLLFDVITLWEVFEHIRENDLDQVIDNIKTHLAPHGLLIASIAPTEDKYGEFHLHQTVKNLSWWLEIFQKKGLYRMSSIEKFFSGQYVRGGKIDRFSHTVVLSKDPSKAPKLPSKSCNDCIKDFWFNSFFHKKIRNLVNG